MLDNLKDALDMLYSFGNKLEKHIKSMAENTKENKKILKILRKLDKNIDYDAARIKEIKLDKEKKKLDTVKELQRLRVDCELPKLSRMHTKTLLKKLIFINDKILHLYPSNNIERGYEHLLNEEKKEIEKILAKRGK